MATQATNLETPDEKPNILVQRSVDQGDDMKGETIVVIDEEEKKILRKIDLQ
jgi:hypothetical protein